MKNQTPTFKKIFEQWFAHYQQTVAKVTADKTYWLLHNKAIPVIGDMPIDTITPQIVLELSNHVAKTAPKQARRLVLDIVRIIDYAVIVLNIIEHNKLSKVICFIPKKAEIGMKFVYTNQLPILFNDINHCKCNDIVKQAFYLLVYTALRRAEIVNAKKSEFDLKNKIWTIPAERMKVAGNGDHVIPLAPQVIELITPLFDNQSDYLFALPNRPEKPFNAWSLTQLMKNSGWQGKQTLHGFRKIFSTHAHLSRLWTIDAIELSLAHKIRGVRGVYNHADMLDERVELMNWWADEVDKWRGVV